jgi:hypothetical protein
MKLNFAHLAVFTLVVSGAFAATAAQAGTQAFLTPNHLNFFISDMQEAPDQVFYGCDDVQSTATTLLQKLGATQIQVHCNGGLDEFGNYSDPSVTLSFDSLQASGHGAAVGANWKSVLLEGAQNCDLIVQVLDQVKGSFDIQSLTGDSSCMTPDSPYSISATVLMSN